MNKFEEKNGAMFYIVETNTMKLNIPTNIYTVPKALRTKEDIPIIEWNMPKPNIRYLDEFVKRAAHIYNLYKAEMEAFILWDTQNKKHIFYVPTQEVSGASVKFEWTIPENCVLMFELHSHHVMGISFSSTDDNNDGNVDILPHISAVLKNIDKFNMLKPDDNVDIRLSYMGNRTMLKIKDLFEMETYSMPQIKQYIAPAVVNTPTQSVWNGYYGYNKFAESNKTANPVTRPTFGNDLEKAFTKEKKQDVGAFDKLEDSEDVLDFVNKCLQEELKKKKEAK